MKLSITENKTEYGLDYVEIRGCEEFNVAHIFECGQCFRWNFYKGINGFDMYLGVAGAKAAAVSAFRRNDENVIVIANATLEDYELFWRAYFDFNRDYGEICSTLSAKDEHLRRAVQFGGGIRILRQEIFETLISFILSANNNIPRIKGCVEKLCSDYGDVIVLSEAFRQYIKQNTGAEVEKMHAFPSAQQLAGVTAAEYSACCKAGYRCAYMEKTVECFIEKPDLLLTASQDSATLRDARDIAMSYCGVGPKVADCILLFTGLRTDVFPVDVWVRRVLCDLYFHRDVSRTEAERFAAEYFGSLAGFAQQYLFYFMREENK